MAPQAIFLTALVVGFSGAMAPGPISTMVISESGRRGFWAGPLLTFGHAIAEVIIVVGLACGLPELLANAHVKLAIALAGGVFLLWMGQATLRDAWRGASQPITSTSVRSATTAWGPAWAGLVASFTNPYWIVWWSTTGAYYVVLSLQHGAQGVAAFYSGHILSDLTWNSLLALLMVSGKRWLPGNVMRGFLAIAGIFLVGLGVYFLASGIRSII